MSDAERKLAARDALIEEAVSAFRERDLEGRPVPPPAWWDLPVGDLDELYRRQLMQRGLERALDPNGHSSTVMAIMARLV